MARVDLTSPLRSIAPGLDSAVLEVLARTESGLSASRIAALSARGTRAGQLPVLNRLVEHGLVRADPANTGFLYRLNREHLLAPAVLAAAVARREILDRLTAAVMGLVPVPMHASMFGSFARGEAGADSDLDLLLVTDDECRQPRRGVDHAGAGAWGSGTRVDREPSGNACLHPCSASRCRRRARTHRRLLAR